MGEAVCAGCHHVQHRLVPCVSGCPCPGWFEDCTDPNCTDHPAREDG